MSRGTVSLIGAGAAGPVVFRALVRAGWAAGSVASPRLVSAQRAVAFAGGGDPTRSNRSAAAADLVVIAVPDDRIASVAKEIASAVRPGSLALHLSGALSSRALAPLAAAGASTGSLHPLLSFADPETAAARLPGSFLFYEGDEPERLRAVAEDLGGTPVPLNTEGKALYHAGAAAACNLAVVMVDLGVRLMAAAGIGGDQALAALLPLVEGTVANLAAVGLPQALTGPVARGDVLTISSHLRAIREKAPSLVAPYVAASLYAVDVALRKGSLGPDRAEALRAALAPPEGEE